MRVARRRPPRRTTRHGSPRASPWRSERQDEIAQAIGSDGCRSVYETRLPVLMLLDGIKCLRKHLRRGCVPSGATCDDLRPARAAVLFQPLGVISALRPGTAVQARSPQRAAGGRQPCPHQAFRIHVGRWICWGGYTRRIFDPDVVSVIPEGQVGGLSRDLPTPPHYRVPARRAPRMRARPKTSCPDARLGGKSPRSFTSTIPS
jgi:hypothetical protein